MLCVCVMVGLIACTGSVKLVRGSQAFSAYLDRSYDTTEPTAEIVCNIDGPTSAAAGKQIVVKDAGGRTLASQAEFRDDTRLAFPSALCLRASTPSRFLFWGRAANLSLHQDTGRHFFRENRSGSDAATTVTPASRRLRKLSRVSYRRPCPSRRIAGG